MGQSVRVAAHDGLVGSDTSVVIDITRLGQAHDGVNENVRLVLSRSSNGEFSMGAVHRVTSLESGNLAP